MCEVEMKRKLSLQGLFTNLILIAIILTVSAVTFFPQTALPSYSANSIKAIYNGDRAKPNVSLMFNVYENAEIVDKIATTILLQPQIRNNLTTRHSLIPYRQQ